MLASEFEYGRALDNTLKDEAMSSVQDGNVGVNQANMRSSLDISVHRNESVNVDERDWSKSKELSVDLMSSQEIESTVDVDGRACSAPKETSVDLLSSQGKNDSEEPEDVEIGSSGVRLAALISHGSLDLQDDYGAFENMLRQFDMNMAYQPCLGMARMA
ncbi:DExH-box ATP-dependent RNA helicase DExH7 [Cucumis melo var. makuwa]|uniref:DExH-box ATP-dependent RNA helicase DExH7 n=1 Tax=Cucumis melo var. makuwa TaxID=1194695 RepID=A0A5D3CJA7_CUCMM|nr:DExH-box ATP-dependent RNA helicase DExH7 [Cucumis melo var. makuwa]